MRSTRLLAASLAILAVAACASSTPGWTYAPAPSPTAVPSVAASGSVAPSASASAVPSGSAAPSAAPSAASSAPSGSAAPSGAGTVVQLSAQSIAFDPTELSAPADQAFQIEFANNEAGIPHNVEVKDSAGASKFNGEIFPGVETRTYDVPPLAAGAYQFVCSVHPNMTGTLTVQ